MENIRLLERIRQMDQRPYWRDSFSPEVLQESILKHLSHILNTRQGSAIIAQDFGIPDFSTLTTSFDSKEVARLEKGIQRVISRYEKRLKKIQITFTPDSSRPLSILFQITGELVTSRGKTNLSFNTILSSQGPVTIENFQAF